MQILNSLREGESARVVSLAPSEISDRLRDIGVIEGTFVTCLHTSPLGDPAAYRIRGAVIALRACDAGTVLVEAIEA